MPALFHFFMLLKKDVPAPNGNRPLFVFDKYGYGVYTYRRHVGWDWDNRSGPGGGTRHLHHELTSWDTYSLRYGRESLIGTRTTTGSELLLGVK